MNELQRVRIKVHNTGSLRESFSSLTPNQAQFRSFGLCFSELINNLESTRRMKRLASCPGWCGTWRCQLCLLCTPENVCTINTTAEVTTGPRGIRTSCSLSRPTSPPLTHLNTQRELPGHVWRCCDVKVANITPEMWRLLTYFTPKLGQAYYISRSTSD